MTTHSNAADIPPRRYEPAPLARLLEIVSAINCECPNHVARLVINLMAFEDYSKDCENRDDDDARIHAMLYRETAKAREVMEAALARLLEHEGVVMPD